MNAMPSTSLRSVLFLPASSERAIEKARSLDCDAVILDLEDAVAPEEKPAARERMVAALGAGGFRAPVVAVRVNGLDTPWADADLRAAAQAGAGVAVAPKVSGAANLKAYREALPEATRLWANIETCEGILNLREIAGGSRGAGCDAFIFGQNDLTRDMGLRPSRDRRPLHAAMSLTVTAARASGLAAIDGVFNDFGDPGAFEAECEEGRLFGFDGKALIHPSQIGIAERVYSPSERDLEWARAVIAAFEDPANAGKGAVRVGAAMAERLHLDQARRMLSASRLAG